jgi:hypothetical protein
LEDAVLQWLDGNYGNAQLEQPDKAILTGAVDKMESVGKSFGE